MIFYFLKKNKMSSAYILFPIMGDYKSVKVFTDYNQAILYQRTNSYEYDIHEIEINNINDEPKKLELDNDIDNGNIIFNEISQKPIY